MPLSCSICKPVGVKSSQELIVEHLWNCPQLVRPANRKAQPDYTPYFGFYTHQCRIALQASPRLGTRSHQDVLDLAHKITADEPREKLEDALSSMEEKSEGIQEEERLEKAAASIDLVVRLMLMIEVGELKNTFSGRQPLVWTKGTVDDFVHELFEPQTSQNLERGKFGRLFTAQNLALIAGFRVELTTNLADHLLFRDSDKTVMIFHHATFLSHQLGNTIFPPDFVSETLDTLALLFPQNDAASRKWYRKQGERSELDMAVLNCGSRHRRTRLEEYHYWHDRLLILKEEFDEARPTTIAQWWNDRRDGIQWYSLWIVMGLTLFFGLVQSIEGAVQVYQGMKSSGG